MAKQIDTYPNDFCKSGCPNAQFTVDTTVLHCENMPYHNINMFVCLNEPVCKMWIEEIERMRTHND